jgi:gas vesicle protein
MPSSKKKPFRMRTEPVKPKRMEQQEMCKWVSNYGGAVSASKLIRILQKTSEEESIPLHKIKYNYDGKITWRAPEPMEDYQKRVDAWKKKHNRWKKWAKDYVEEIKEYKKNVALKEAKATASKIKSLKERQDKIDEAMLKLQKKAQEEEQLLYELSK